MTLVPRGQTLKYLEKGYDIFLTRLFRRLFIMPLNRAVAKRTPVADIGRDQSLEPVSR